MNNLAKSFICVLIGLLINGLFFGFYLNGYGPTVANLLSGFLLDEPFTNTYFVCCMGQNHLLATLYALANQINWYSVYVLFQTSAALFIWVYLIFSTDRFVDIYKWACAILAMTVHSPFMMELDATFSSALVFMLSTIAVISTNNLNRTTLIIINVLAGIAVLMRFDTTFVFGAIFLLAVVGFNLTRLKLLVAKLPLPWFVFGCIGIALLFDLTEEPQLYREAQPTFYFVSDGEFRIPISYMKTPVDSIKYEAVQQILINDPNSLDAAFVKSLLISNFDTKALGEAISLGINKLVHAIQFISLKYTVLIVIILALIVILGLQKPQALYRFTLALMLMFIVGLLVKFQPRVIFPVLLSLLAYFLFNTTFKWKASYLLIASGICFLAVSVSNFNLSNSLKKSAETNSVILSKLDNLSGDIVIDGTTSAIFSTNAWDSFSHLKNNYYTVDMGQLTLMPQYQNFLKDICSCNPQSSKEVYQFLKDSKVYYLSTQQRVELITKYHELIYDYNMEFVDAEMDLAPSTNFRLYQIQ